jgi:hypothetical protein
MRPALTLLVSSAMAIAAYGCNAILGNDPGVLAIVGEGEGEGMGYDAGSARTEAPPSATATGRDAAVDAAQALSTPATPDAGDACAGGEGGCVDPCGGGACAPVCKDGFADCNLDAVDGCEAKLVDDSMNCGACGVVCPAGSACKGKTCKPTHAPPP